MKRTNRERALQVINHMTDECSAHVLANRAGVALGTMLRYLVQEKKRGNVEYRSLKGRYGRWRRIN